MREGLVALPYCSQNPVCLGRGRRLFRVYETHLLGQFPKRWFVDEFRKLAMRRSDPLALGAGQLLDVHQKEQYIAWDLLSYPIRLLCFPR